MESFIVDQATHTLHAQRRHGILFLRDRGERDLVLV